VQLVQKIKEKNDISLNHIEAAKDVLSQEIRGLEALIGALDQKFSEAVELLSAIKGRIIVSGMGKSGHVARKIAATMASTGTPSFFVHPAEASHGDLGMIAQDDAVILLSNSGETSELGDIIHYCKRFSIPLIAMVRRESSTLVSAADIAFVLPEIAEASPVNAPTTSTTMMLAWGDALAVALLQSHGFNKDDFGVFHPGGKLGSQFITVEQLMKKDADLPVVRENSIMSDTLITMTEKSLGCAVVTDEMKCVVGVVTDGDLRRHMGSDLTQQTAKMVMTPNPVTVSATMLASEALAIMNEKSITSLIVADEAKILYGIVHIHDVLRAGVS